MEAWERGVPSYSLRNRLAENDLRNARQVVAANTKNDKLASELAHHFVDGAP